MTLAGLKDAANTAFKAGISAADPEACLKKALAETPMPIPDGGKYLLISIGKAACKMADCAIKTLPKKAAYQAIAVTNYENETPVDGCMVFAAGHPVPDQNGLNAANAVMAMVASADVHDVVVALVSGGSSALLPAPAKGLSLQDKIAVNELILLAGFDITEMNLVRQSLSALKGGGLARLAMPAQVRSYVLSDVVGDDLRVIGSGPSIAPIGTKEEAQALLRVRGLWADLPKSVHAYYAANVSGSEQARTADAFLIGGNSVSLAAMASAAKAQVIHKPLEGDVADAARVILEHVQAAPKSGPLVLAFGGETTVVATGKGKGGRNQELALRFALLAEAEGLSGTWCFLSGGTDGRDGPTDAAGGLVDGGTLSRIRAQGLDPTVFLSNNDSYHALKTAGDLIQIAATGTNVADLQIFLRE